MDGGEEMSVNRETEVVVDLETEREWLEQTEAGEEMMDAEDTSTALIVANCPAGLFGPAAKTVKDEFEGMVKSFDVSAWVEWFPSFRRVRVNFGSSAAATQARLHCDHLPFHGSNIRVFYAQVFKAPEPGSCFLSPPPLEKQFLISPPCSPPVGWEQTADAAPVLNPDLLQRLAALSATREAVHVGEVRTELHPATDETPSIIVHTAPLVTPPPDDGPCLLAPDDHHFPRPAKLPRTPRPPTSA